jgi:hypothetical protein
MDTTLVGEILELSLRRGALGLCTEYLRMGEADVQGNNWTALVGFEH